MKYIYKYFHVLSLLLLFTLNIYASNNNQVRQLFNGVDLEGWHHVGSGKFEVKNHMLVTEDGMGLLFYENEKFTNVKLKVVYKTSRPTSNSGVFIRIGNKPGSAWEAVNNGYEIQICDKGKEAFDDYHRTGAVYSFSRALVHAEKKPGEWNVMEVMLKEEFIKVILNGTLVSEYSPMDKLLPRNRDSDPERGPRAIQGYIGLQNHDHTSRFANDHVYFREVSVQSLD